MKSLFQIAVLAAVLLCQCFGSYGQRADTAAVSLLYDREYLDTVSIVRKTVVNDYTSVGIQYGLSLNRVSFNPVKYQSLLIRPVNFGVTYSRYGKMFGYMPYFGFQIGVFYGQDGYTTRFNKESGSRPHVDGAYEAVYDYVELPCLALFHADILRLRLMGSLGLYGGYRLAVRRSGGPGFDTDYAERFYDHDIRWDYGIKGGAGFAILLDPVEFHVQAQLRYGYSSLYRPDYYSEYYYRYAYPFDIVISAGLQFQLTRRTGKTNAQLRREARNIVYNKQRDEDNQSDGR